MKPIDTNDQPQWPSFCHIQLSPSLNCRHWGQTPIYPLGMWWVYNGFWNKIPSMNPLGPFWLLLKFAPNLPTQYPPGTCWVFSKSTQHKAHWGWCWFTHWVNVGQITSKTLDFFHNSHQKVSGRNFVKEPLGFFQKSPHKLLVMCLSHSLWVCWGFV